MLNGSQPPSPVSYTTAKGLTNNGVALNLSAISTACRFYFPWIRDASNNGVNRAGLGDATKVGSAGTAQVVGFMRSGAGTPRSAGLYWTVPAALSYVDLTLYTMIMHADIKMTVGTQRFFYGPHVNSTTPGCNFRAETDGGLTVYYMINGVVSNFTKIAGMIDGTVHGISVVIDRHQQSGQYSASIYADDVLRETKLFALTGSEGTHNTWFIGAYSLVDAAVDCDFSNMHLYAVDRDLADINVQLCVDKMFFNKQCLTVGDAG
jgi:hypothetical protein